MSLAVVRDHCSVEVRGASDTNTNNNDSKNDDEAVFIIAGKGQFYFILSYLI